MKTFVKHILCLLRTVAKSKTMAIKSKTDAIRARFVVFSLLRNRKLSLSAVSDRIHALLGHQQDTNPASAAAAEEDDEQGKAIVLYNTTDVSADNTCMELDTCCNVYPYHYDNDVDDDDKYPDLTHSLFDEDDDDELDLGDPNASVIDLVRNSKEEGENFILEDEINHVADLFIPLRVIIVVCSAGTSILNGLGTFLSSTAVLTRSSRTSPQNHSFTRPKA